MTEQFDYTNAYREHGNGIYLQNGQTYEEVVAQDAAILAKHGVAAEDVGRSLRTLFSTYNTFHELKVRTLQNPHPRITLGRMVFELGFEPCRYLPGVTSNIDWQIWVEGLGNGNKAYHPPDGPTFVSDMVPAMIERLAFFEGDVFYGIKPEWAVTVHKIVKQANLEPYEPKFTNIAWEGSGLFFASWEGQKSEINPLNARQIEIDYRTPEEREDRRYTPKYVIKNAFHHEQITPVVEGWVAPGDLDLRFRSWSRGNYSDRPADSRRNLHWGVIVAKEPTILPPDASLLGINFDKYISKLEPGDMHVVRIWPYTQKQVA